MKSIQPRYAGVVAALIATYLILGALLAFGTVDLIFVKDGYEVKRCENVTILDDLFGDVELYTEEGKEFTYTYSEDLFGLHIEEEYNQDFAWNVPVRLVLNTLLFRFGEEANDIVLTVTEVK
jgi:hypothetical protein